MQLIPPTIPPDTPSDGEKLIFELLAADSAPDAGHSAGDGPGPDGWTALHSFDIAHHRRQVEGEVDFLVVAPGLGLLVLEVKGCHRLRRERGLWYYGADAGGDPRGPFKQASEAMYSLRARLVKHRPHLSRVLFQSAVCFPFLDFTETSEEWHSWQVIDRAKLGQRSITECLAAVLEQARKRVVSLRKGWFDPSSGEPTPKQCDEIVHALRSDFEFFESLKARAKRVDDEIRRYTERQFEALDHMRRMPRVIFDGPAGTGKTLLALEAVRRGHAAGLRVLLLCFNRPLAEWLHEQSAGLADATTVSEHMVRAAGIPPGSPKLHGGSEFWDEDLPLLACEGLLDNPTEYDTLVIDEAQDVLRGQFLDVLDLSLRGGLREGTWRIFGDFAHQAIYDDSVDLAGFCAGQGGGCAVFELDENCRNAPRVAALALAGLRGGADRGGSDAAVGPEGSGATGPAATVPSSVSGFARVLRDDDGMEPEVRFYASAGQQRELLCAALEGLRSAGFSGPRVAILSMRKDADCIAATLTEQPWRDRLVPLVHDGPQGPVVDLHSGKTRYASIHRFKGLEARAVVLTDIEALDTPRRRDLFYVGATRATQRLVVLAHESLSEWLGECR